MKIIEPYFKTEIFQVQDYLTIQLNLSKASAPIPLEKLFEVALRKNKKRAFLFVSKILGKHLAIDPKIPLLGGMLLAYQLKGMPLEEAIQLLEEHPMDEKAFRRLQQKKAVLDKKTLVIGFAETATGLGHSVFASCKGEVSYIHTTREQIVSEAPVFTFQEVHSHAMQHQCFAEKPKYFDEFENIILVDDEITTGHTALHLIEALHDQSYHRQYIVLSLLDWRSSEQKDEAVALEEKLKIQIHFISLVQGEMVVEMQQPIPEKLMVLPQPISQTQEERLALETVRVKLGERLQKTTHPSDGRQLQLLYTKATGRFGLSLAEEEKNEKVFRQIGHYLKKLRKYPTCLVIGTEEFMYIPCVLASYMGEGVSYQSSTRSPIITQEIEGYPIQSVIAYERPEDHAVINYLYNILPGRFEEAFWILERDVSENFKAAMVQQFKAQGFQKLTFIVCDGI